ncbi:hypothetical protein TNCV_1389591 [Trichonephila clavipes]|nr:hypothetical protein TNCV_1389591 [Trichonephila clavipes]
MVRASDSRLEGLGSMPDATKHPPCTHTDLLAEIVEVEIDVVSSSIVPSGNFAELNRTVTCLVLKANDRCTSCPCHDEFRGPRSDYVRQKYCILIAFFRYKLCPPYAVDWRFFLGDGLQLSTALCEKRNSLLQTLVFRTVGY